MLATMHRKYGGKMEEKGILKTLFDAFFMYFLYFFKRQINLFFLNIVIAIFLHN